MSLGPGVNDSGFNYTTQAERQDFANSPVNVNVQSPGSVSDILGGTVTDKYKQFFSEFDPTKIKIAEAQQKLDMQNTIAGGRNNILALTQKRQANTGGFAGSGANQYAFDIGRSAANTQAKNQMYSSLLGLQGTKFAEKKSYENSILDRYASLLQSGARPEDIYTDASLQNISSLSDSLGSKSLNI